MFWGGFIQRLGARHFFTTSTGTCEFFPATQRARSGDPLYGVQSGGVQCRRADVSRHIAGALRLASPVLDPVTADRAGLVVKRQNGQ